MDKRRYYLGQIRASLSYHLHIIIFCAMALICSAFQLLHKPPAIVPEKTSRIQNACGITVNAGPDITICAGASRQLNGTVNGTTQYAWEPPDGLSNPNILNPIASPGSTTVYTLTARAVSNNLITNGNFETGNIAPATSGYTPYTVLNSFVTSTGGYMVMTVPQIVAAFGCTPNIGNYAMVITPTGSGTNIWCQTIPVSRNTEYKITYKVFGIPYIFGSPPSINLRVNGQVVGSVDALSGLCLENSGSFVWNSGSATSAQFCLFNTGGTGPFSMCAIDNIEVRECCVATDTVKVEVYELVADILPPPEISCDNRPLTIDASGSSKGPGISYQWTTRNGIIKSGDKTLMPVVDTPGTYVLRITGQHGCTKEATVIVNGSVTPPDITLKKSDIECTKPLGSIEANSKAKRPKFEWSGPNAFFSNKPIINNLADAGEYIVKVVDIYGCENTDTVVLKDLRQDVDINIKGDTIRCGQSEAVLIGKSVSKKPRFTWSDSKGNTFDSSHWVVRDTGWYYLTVKDSLGCTVTDSFYVLNFNSSIPIKTFTDTIDCVKTNVALKYLGDTSGTITWRGPNRFQSNERNPLVQDSGWYYITVQTSQGCFGFDSVYISKSAEIPDIVVSDNDTLTCSKKQIQLQGSSNTPGVKWEWLKDNNTISDQQIVNVTEPGQFTFKVKAPNGCEITRSVEITNDTAQPHFTLVEDTITCDKPRITLQVLGIEHLGYQWQGPNNFAANIKSPSTITSGKYTLTVTGRNHCTAAKEIEIALDIQKPVADLQADTINCINRVINIRHQAGADIRTYQWSGPNGFTSQASNPAITRGGVYTLTLTANNGCTNTEVVEILEDLVQPSFRLRADTIQCNKVASVYALQLKPEYRIRWKGPNGFSSDLSVVQVTDSGYYVLTVTAPNGCSKTDSVLVIQKDRIPDIFAVNDTLTCLKSKIRLRAGSGTPNVRFEWKGPNSFVSDLPNPEVQDSGTYVLRVIDANGCEASKVIYIAKSASPTPFNIVSSGRTIDCKDSTLLLRLNVRNENYLITWANPGGTAITEDSIRITQPGLYIAQLINQDGCISRDSISIADARKLPVFALLSDSINCLKTTARLRVNTRDNQLRFNWSGPNGFTSNDSTATTTVGGYYVLRVTNEVNCAAVDSVFIAMDTSAPDLVLSSDTLNCNRQSVPVLASSRTGGFTLQWSGPNNFQYNLPRFITSVAGEYFCTITSSKNGCKTTKKIDVIEDTARIHQIEVSKKDASCLLSNGRIDVTAVYGGRPNYQYSFDNGLSFTSSAFKDGLNAGNYQLVVRDQNQCTFSSAVSINNANGVNITPLQDLLMELNEERDIALQISLPLSEITEIRWYPSDLLSCSDCPRPRLTAKRDERITVEVTDKNGCTDSVSFQLRIKSTTGVYFPNVFSPNNDGVNDRFYPVGDPNAEVLQWAVFDRWGEMIFQQQGNIVNDSQKGWNGEYNGKKVLPGVYVYMARVKLNDEIKSYRGEISLLR